MISQLSHPAAYARRRHHFSPNYRPSPYCHGRDRSTSSTTLNFDALKVTIQLAITPRYLPWQSRQYYNRCLSDSPCRSNILSVQVHICLFSSSTSDLIPSPVTSPSVRRLSRYTQPNSHNFNSNRVLSTLHQHSTELDQDFVLLPG